MFNFEEELKKLPKEPGVYIMRDDRNVILYVGKAINLHNRVRSYFRENIGRGPMIDKMVSLIARFEYIVTDSELEALVLENNLIKENSPKYNTLLKDDNHRTRGLYFNNVELPIDTHSEGFKLITRVQDEAHRFAIEYHRSLRSKSQVKSVLDEIPGVGPARRKALMRHFKSIEEIKTADVEMLAALPEVNRRAAEEIYRFFHQS